MANEPLGYVEQRQEERGRFARFFYRAPAFRPEDTTVLKARIRELETENADLKARMESLECEAVRLRSCGAYVRRPDSMAKPAEVAAVFCKMMRDIGYEIDGVPYMLEHLTMPRRSQVCARPRQVFMWIACRACAGHSLPALGKFLSRDHTSVMHGRNKAPGIMAEDAALRSVAHAVLANFGVKVPE